MTEIFHFWCIFFCFRLQSYKIFSIFASEICLNNYKKMEECHIKRKKYWKEKQVCKIHITK